MKKISILFFVILFSWITNAQTAKVSGVVTAFNRYPLKGVEVKAKKSKQVVQTDSLGCYEIECLKKDVVLFNAEGFMRVRTMVKGDEVVKTNMVIMNTESAFNNVVAKGYLTSEEMEYAKAYLMEENNDYSKYQDICQLLQAVVPAAKCRDENGINRVYLTSKPQSFICETYALCVVDGIVTEDISDIAPIQVAKIRALGPEETSDWGMRGGNGVLVIELKGK